ncbi:hypothetical protein MLP_10200 [Microlunatus phosphovorus NM-1]|uniref:Cupin type-2 domain-containing protein n=1 Tax=Microlunatus phosphovorus (strain ATCC 700054 / DSM 10555 / JCM 9379 / NBRC 101784 / NCIMB 13414 / VKM Ac-1990 / NM-1) TaxID=1032480 RepID=F5XMW1_MICPN|nr:cupin domain-containing protein [Microlunatus phosphovorus]BAK34034.1 hypothetical protein MLP_10200 [Microlunatus phosphovorus NM-1]
MSVVQAPSAPTHTLGGTTFTSLATPSRGSTTDNSLWRVQLAPGTTPTPHSLTREEIFLVLRGTADVTIDGVQETALTGSAIVVPSGVPFGLGNDGDEPVELLCCLPVGGQAQLGDGTLLTPPWAQ